MPLRCAILDDYQNVALTMADWSKVEGDIGITVFNDHLGPPENVVAALEGFAIVCAMRERTAFPRAVIEALPNLELLITTGMRNASIDLEAAKARNVIVCGTPSFGNATAALAVGLMLELARRIGYENARLKAGAVWQSTIGLDLEGQTLALLGLGRLGTKVAQIAKALGMNAIAWSQNLTAVRTSCLTSPLPRPTARMKIAAKATWARRSPSPPIATALSMRYGTRARRPWRHSRFTSRLPPVAAKTGCRA